MYSKGTYLPWFLSLYVGLSLLFPHQIFAHEGQTQPVEEQKLAAQAPTKDRAHDKRSARRKVITVTTVAGSSLLVLGLIIKWYKNKTLSINPHELNAQNTTAASSSWLSTMAEKLGSSWLGRKIMQKMFDHAARQCDNKLMQQVLAKALTDPRVQQALSSALNNEQLHKALAGAAGNKNVQQLVAEALGNKNVQQALAGALGDATVQQALADLAQNGSFEGMAHQENIKQALADALNNEHLQQALAGAAQNEHLQKAVADALNNPEFRQALADTGGDENLQHIVANALNNEGIAQALANTLNNEQLQQALADVAQHGNVSHVREGMANGQEQQESAVTLGGEQPATMCNLTGDELQSLAQTIDGQAAQQTVAGAAPDIHVAGSSDASSSTPVNIDLSKAAGLIDKASTSITNSTAGRLLGRLGTKLGGWLGNININLDLAPSPSYSPKPKINTLLDAVMLTDLPAVQEMCRKPQSSAMLNQALVLAIATEYNKNKTIAILQELLKQPGIDINTLDREPITSPPAWYENYSLNRNRYTYENYLKFHQKNKTPLMLAAHFNDRAITKLLLQDNRTQIDKQNRNGKTALIESTDSCGDSRFSVSTDDNVLNILLDHGANADLTDNKGHTALWYLIERYRRIIEHRP